MELGPERVQTYPVAEKHRGKWLGHQVQHVKSTFPVHEGWPLMCRLNNDNLSLSFITRTVLKALRDAGKMNKAYKNINPVHDNSMVCWDPVLFIHTIGLDESQVEFVPCYHFVFVWWVESRPSP